MAKDKKGKFHPIKGKPSGSDKESPLPGGIEDAHIMHPNRNVNKDEGDYIEKSETASYRSKLHNESRVSVHDKPVLAQEIKEPVTKEFILKMASQKADRCISLFMPTHRAGIEVNEQQDLIAFKTMLQEIASDLKEQATDRKQIDLILEPANELIRNEKFWTNLSEGLAVFITEDSFRYMKLPVSPKQSYMIGNSLTIGPIIPLLQSHEYFYILSLDKTEARLYHAGSYDIREIEIPELSEETKNLLSSATNSENTFGVSDTDKIRLTKAYFEKTEGIIREKILNKEKVPLLLAGEDELIQVYREISHYEPTWDEALSGNYGRVNKGTIHEKAKEIMAPYLKQHLDKALKAYYDGLGTLLSSEILDDIIRASYEGRISELFVREAAERWGKISENAPVSEIHEVRNPGDDNIIEQLMVQTLLKNGDVHILKPEKMPVPGPVAALMRY
jgi:hypothetical protein